MLFQALYEFAQFTRTPWADGFPTKTRLIDSPEFESGPIHWLVCLDSAGRFKGFESLADVEEFKPVPRTLEPKDSGEVAEFLIESFETVFCLGESAAEKRTPKGENKHHHFWSRIEEAAKETSLPELQALLAFKHSWPTGQIPPGIAFQLYQAPKAREGKEQWMVRATKGDMAPLRLRPTAPAAVSFRVGDQMLIQIPAVLEWWSAWYATWLLGEKQKCIEAHGGPGFCLVTGQQDAAISGYHLPKIYGVRKTLQSGGTLVSSQADAFHSYGLSIAWKGKSGTENDAIQLAEHEEKLAERAAKKERGARAGGKPPQAPTPEPKAKDQYNFTDSESRIMKAGNGNHFEQSYNAQAVVEVESRLIVGERVSQSANDKQELVADLQAIPPQVGAVESVLTDSGFYSEQAVRAVEQTAADQPSGTTVYAAMERKNHHRSVADLEKKEEPAAPLIGASRSAVMKYRMGTSAGKEKYKLRQQTVEPVFGIIKSVLGFRQFMLRGWEKVQLEWTLVCAAYNLKRLHRMSLAKKVAGAG